MNGDTAKPSNEGSGVRKEVEVNHVKDEEVRKLFDARKYEDVKGRFVVCQPKTNIKSKSDINNPNSTSDSNASGGYVNVESPKEFGLDQILGNECVVISLPRQDDKSKANRKAKNALKAKQQAEKEAEEKGEDLDK